MFCLFEEWGALMDIMMSILIGVRNNLYCSSFQSMTDILETTCVETSREGKNTLPVSPADCKRR